MDKLVVAVNNNDILSRFWKTGRYEKKDSSLKVVDTGSDQTQVVNGSSDGKQASNGGVAETLSPAMDILVSSNFERLLYYLALEGTTDDVKAVEGEKNGEELAKVREAQKNVNCWMDSLKSTGQVIVPEKAVEIARRDMIADRCDDTQVSLIVIPASQVGSSDDFRIQTTATIQKYFENTNKFGSYVADPHTAVGLAVAERLVATK